MWVADQTGWVHEALLPYADDQPAPPLTSVSTGPPCPPARSPPGPFRDSFLPVVCSLLHHHRFFLCWDRSHQSSAGKQNLPCFPTPCPLPLLCSVPFCSCLLRPAWGLRRWRLSLSRSCGLCLWLVNGQHLLSLPLTTLPLCAHITGICVQSPLVTKTPVPLESGAPRGLILPFCL